MFSKSELKFITRKSYFNKNYQYVLSHRIFKKINEFEHDLDHILEKDNDLMINIFKGMCENFLTRVGWKEKRK